MVERKILVNFRVSEAERDMLTALTEREDEGEGESVSTYLRRLIRRRFDSVFEEGRAKAKALEKVGQAKATKAQPPEPHAKKTKRRNAIRKAGR